MAELSFENLQRPVGYASGFVVGLGLIYGALKILQHEFLADLLEIEHPTFAEQIATTFLDNPEAFSFIFVPMALAVVLAIDIKFFYTPIENSDDQVELSSNEI